MSAVSEESHQPGSAQQPASAPQQAAGPDPSPGQADFGANEWLVEELYQRYLADPASVDRAWWSFFADYTPALANGTGPQPVITAVSPSGAPPAAPPQVPQAAPPAARPGVPAVRRVAAGGPAGARRRATQP